jgi:hypothetical protein
MQDAAGGGWRVVLAGGKRERKEEIPWGEGNFWVGVLRRDRENMKREGSLRLEAGQMEAMIDFFLFISVSLSVLINGEILPTGILLSR